MRNYCPDFKISELVIAFIALGVMFGSIAFVCQHYDFSPLRPVSTAGEQQGCAHLLSYTSGAQPTSIKAWQQFLSDEGYYHGKIDGYLSNDWINSKTQKAWDDWYCDMMAKEFMEVE